jgi:tetratricopeptide (TPR) repeat protein
MADQDDLVVLGQSVTGSQAQRDINLIGKVDGDVFIDSTVIHNSGTRGQFIEEYSGPADVDCGWLMAQPSRLLDARSRVVDFIDRPELEQLAEWRDATEQPLSVLLLHAPGGQGKSRLAAEFAERSRDQRLASNRRWRVLQARLDSAAPSGAAQPASAEACAGTLLIVDYADRWAHTELIRLIADPRLQEHGQLRVLLLGRTVRWYAAVRGELAEQHAHTTDIRLRPLPADRLSTFAAARDRYAQPDLYNLSNAEDITPPGELEHNDFGLVLTVHMAALVAVDARARGRPTPSEPHALSAYLLDREYLAWQRLFDAGKQGADFQTRPSVMRQVVFASALTGPLDHRAGTHAVESLRLPGHPQDILLDHRYCYPPAAPDRVLEPLYPDRLAEDFLGLLVPGHDVSGYDPDPWATAVPATLLTDDDQRAADTSRAITFLATAACRWPHLGQRVLYPLLREHPQLALEAGNAALTAIAEIDSDDPAYAEALMAMDQVMPADRHVELDTGIAAITERVVARLVATMSDRVTHAQGYYILGWRQENAGQREEARASLTKAVEIFRDLDLDQPNLFHFLAEAKLADLLRHGGGDLLEEHAAALRKLVDQLDAALSMMASSAPTAAAGILRQLQEIHDFFRSQVSSGRQEGEPTREARTIGLEALIALYKKIYTTSGDQGSPHISPLLRAANAHGLTEATRKLGHLLSASGRHEEALGLAHEAIDSARQQAASNPAAFEPDLAETLVSSILVRSANMASRIEETITAQAAASEEAVTLYRRLAEANPTAFVPALAQALNHLGIAQQARRRFSEALACFQESSEIYRALATERPQEHQGLLAVSMSLLSGTLVDLGRHTETLAAARECVNLLRGLPNGHKPSQASALNSLAIASRT